MGLFAAIGTDKAAHILKNTGYGEAQLVAKSDTLGYVDSGYLLRCCDNDSTGPFFNELSYREWFIAGARRRIDNEIIEGTPPDTLKKIVDHSIFEWPSPDDGRIIIS